MKKFLFFGTMVAMLLGAASCSSDIEPAMDGEVPVSFAVNLGDNIDSRTISDGLKANTLKFAVFENGTEITALAQTVAVANKQATINTKLVKGHTYTFVFWAQNSACTAYNTENRAAVKVNYETVNCNDETRDAFWNWIPNLEVSTAGEITQDIILVRRLSQVNCGITLEAYQEAKRAGVDLKDYDSELKLNSTSDEPIAYNWFNVVAGQPIVGDDDHEEWDLDFKKAPMPNEPLRVGSKSYMYLALNYFQPLVDEFSLADATLVLHHKYGLKPNLTYKWPNSSFKGNYRTNLLIRSLTEDVKFDVIIDQNFANQDNNLDIDGNPIGD